MTHFPVLVILPNDTDTANPQDIGQTVDRLLAPYDENVGGETEWLRAGSRWDWYVIGGHWAGWIGDNDLCRIDELPSDVAEKIGYIVTPNGEWHEHGRPGWFGTVIADEQGKEPEDARDPTSRWAAKRAEILSGHAKHTAICVDCHV